MDIFNKFKVNDQAAEVAANCAMVNQGNKAVIKQAVLNAISKAINHHQAETEAHTSNLESAVEQMVLVMADIYDTACDGGDVRKCFENGDFQKVMDNAEAAVMRNQVIVGVSDD